MHKLVILSFFFGVFIIFFTTPLLQAQNEAAAKPLNGQYRHWSLDYKYGRDISLGKTRLGQINTSPTETRDVSGIGATWFLNPNLSVGGGLSLELGSQTSEDPSGEQEFSTTEIGVLAKLMWYPQGYNGYTWYGFGVYAGYNTFSDKQTFTPATGEASITEFSGSSIRTGLRAEVGFRPSENVNIEFFAGSNLGVEINPGYKITPSSGEEQEGPSSTYFADCGGDVGIRWFFNQTNSQ